MAGLREGLRDLGYIEGGNLRFDHRWAEGRTGQYRSLASELVAAGADVIVTWGTPATLGAKEATAHIPIIAAAVGDPIGNRIVTNLARPEGNITGFSSQTATLVEKRLELVRELLPKASHVTFFFRAANPNTAIGIKHAETVAGTLGLTFTTLDMGDDLDAGFDALARKLPDAVLVSADPVVRLNGPRIIVFMAERRLPAVYASADHVAGGGLTSLGPDYYELFRRAAEYVDRILKGAKPGDLPVQQADRFRLAVNLRTARTLGITIPPTLLARADEVLE
jgi:putative ABC transport system substrate-binding protein